MKNFYAILSKSKTWQWLAVGPLSNQQCIGKIHRRKDKNDAKSKIYRWATKSARRLQAWWSMHVTPGKWKPWGLPDNDSGRGSLASTVENGRCTSGVLVSVVSPGNSAWIVTVISDSETGGSAIPSQQLELLSLGFKCRLINIDDGLLTSNTGVAAAAISSPGSKGLLPTSIEHFLSPSISLDESGNDFLKTDGTDELRRIFGNATAVSLAVKARGPESLRKRRRCGNSHKMPPLPQAPPTSLQTPPTSPQARHTGNSTSLDMSMDVMPSSSSSDIWWNDRASWSPCLAHVGLMLYLMLLLISFSASLQTSSLCSRVLQTDISSSAGPIAPSLFAWSLTAHHTMFRQWWI